MDPAVDPGGGAQPSLDHEAVIGGPGSFVIKADRRKNFAEAILKKIILEIAGNDTDGKRGILSITRSGETGNGIRLLHAQR